jgi:hypothetical protein
MVRCAVCGREFEPDYYSLNLKTQQKYCSAKCRSEGQKLKYNKRKKPAKAKCFWCKKEYVFSRYNPYRKFCSASCCYAYHQIQKRISVLNLGSDELARLEKFGFQYRFPKPYTKLNKLYELH